MEPCVSSFVRPGPRQRVTAVTVMLRHKSQLCDTSPAADSHHIVIRPRLGTVVTRSSITVCRGTCDVINTLAAPVFFKL